MPRKKVRPIFPFPTIKSQGDWVEMVFMVKAASLGMSVSNPFGAGQPYDLIVVTRDGRPVRVQLKSGWRQCGRRYQANMWRKGQTQPYRPREIDFFVVYIPPEDAWYIIPVRKLRRTQVTFFYPHHPRSRGWYEKYRGAWSLITGDPADDSRSLGFTIHACAE